MQPLTGTKPRNSYEGPTFDKLKPERAKEFLLRHADAGDQGAKDILDIVFPRGQNPK
jgi:hypothetical protein